ncbi:hypothetical protein B0I35DRAFT_408516 [Stachybotrys elegans]|uniref:NAD(P)-binding protein n=1 Tax=Stachybotrys elegans TaxID=80388 RepID=A0A8K0SXG2_9HYPO|nr:hypothetical protein B0I35DRAFT_408516 [Stachybotrys elegans]
MDGPVIVFISGVGKGIGRGLAEAYLQRPNHVVVGSIRDESAPGIADLKAAKTGPESKLVLVHIESTAFGDAAKAVDVMLAAGIDHVDVVIANAGGSSPVQPFDTIDPETMMHDYQVNALAPLVLYQALKPLLQKSSRSPKWISVTSAVGSVGAMPHAKSWALPSYGASKAALNWLTVAMHHQNEWLTAVAIHPGLVQTGPGNWVAQRLIKKEKAPITIELCVERMTDIIDKATRQETSGKFLRAIEGAEMPW